MTGNAGPILLITNKGQTIRKLMRKGGGGREGAVYKKKMSLRGGGGGGGGGGGRYTKKIVAQGNEKKFNARQLTLKSIHTTAKKDSYKEFDNEKKK